MRSVVAMCALGQRSRGCVSTLVGGLGGSLEKGPVGAKSGRNAGVLARAMWGREACVRARAMDGPSRPPGGPASGPTQVDGAAGEMGLPVWGDSGHGSVDCAKGWSWEPPKSSQQEGQAFLDTMERPCRGLRPEHSCEVWWSSPSWGSP